VTKDNGAIESGFQLEQIGEGRARGEQINNKLNRKPRAPDDGFARHGLRIERNPFEELLIAHGFVLRV
jgi:hypothetical protein